jgi:hypothetical protein
MSRQRPQHSLPGRRSIAIGVDSSGGAFSVLPSKNRNLSWSTNKKGSRNLPCSLQSGLQRSQWHQRGHGICTQHAATGAFRNPRTAGNQADSSSITKPRLLQGHPAYSPRQLVVTADHVIIDWAESNRPRAQVPLHPIRSSRGVSSPSFKAAFGNCAAVWHPDCGQNLSKHESMRMSNTFSKFFWLALRMQTTPGCAILPNLQCFW